MALGGTIELGARRWDTQDSGARELLRGVMVCHSVSLCVFS